MKPVFCAIAAVSLASCAQMGQLKTATAGGFAKVGDATKDSFAKLMPSRIPVVEVREKDLKEVQSGEQQALAFERTRRNRFWSMFSGPVDFQEPMLPVDAGGMDGELLPPPPAD
ncbi:hypothetical protein OKA04_00485 [Luteolibacter flavescens]|uniref:Lipoprotein n=1 Tax=Luteolibacter flavescens TaxID=1859460 RepID=A0ABT3FIK0_9BACT|nr:hypothetical protein [Luteolibacter flavescens]MCW1883184.1 hypothetical protein [Luteolibacter flavescens]